MADTNLCDGCSSGMSLLEGKHYDRHGFAIMSCQAHKYAAPPPADAALADAIKLACNYYRQAGRVGTTSQTLAKQHEAAADKIIAEALRVRAVMDIDGERYRLLRTFNWNDSPICCVADPKASVRLGCDCPSGDRLDEKLDAMLAASKAEEGKL